MYCKNCGNEINDSQAYCPNCGAETGNKKHFCTGCGKEITDDAAFCENCGTSLKGSAPEVVRPTLNTGGIAPRSLVTAIILSIVTCGIYALYWFVVLTNDMNKISGRENETSGGMALLLTIITCGIYGYIWAYKMGEKRDKIAFENASSNIIYLVLSLFGFGIVVYALAQDAINKAVANQ